MPLSAAQATKRSASSTPTGRGPTRNRPRSAIASGVDVRALSIRIRSHGLSTPRRTAVSKQPPPETSRYAKPAPSRISARRSCSPVGSLPARGSWPSRRSVVSTRRGMGWTLAPSGGAATLWRSCSAGRQRQSAARSSAASSQRPSRPRRGRRLTPSGKQSRRRCRAPSATRPWSACGSTSASLETRATPTSARSTSTRPATVALRAVRPGRVLRPQADDEVEGGLLGLGLATLHARNPARPRPLPALTGYAREM